MTENDLRVSDCPHRCFFPAGTNYVCRKKGDNGISSQGDRYFCKLHGNKKLFSCPRIDEEEINKLEEATDEDE